MSAEAFALEPRVRGGCRGFELLPRELAVRLSEVDHIVSFVGATFNGKSDLVAHVLQASSTSGSAAGTAVPAVAPALAGGCGVSTTVNVNAYFIDGGALLDVEGSDAACAPRMATEVHRATGPQGARSACVGAVFTGLAHLLSDVVVLVECAPLFSRSMYARACRRLSAGAALARRVRPLGTLPQLVIVANKLALADCTADGDEASADFVRSLPEADMVELRRHFNAVRCLCIPYRDVGCGDDGAVATRYAEQLGQLVALVAPPPAPDAARFVWSAQRRALCTDRARMRAALAELLAESCAAREAAADDDAAALRWSRVSPIASDDDALRRERARAATLQAVAAARVATVVVASSAALFFLWRWQRGRRRAALDAAEEAEEEVRRQRAAGAL